MAPPGRLITIEGLDGAGKTTLAAGLEQELRRRRLPVVALREPGGVVLGERIRALLADPALDVDPRAEALLFAASRAQLVAERLAPLLRDGAWVLLDRFVDSSLAYQGGGRELGVDAVAAINAAAVGDLRPDRTLLLRLDPATGRRRLVARGGEADRMERLDEPFFARTAAAYDRIADEDPGRVRVLDATAEPDAVLAAALAALADLLGPEGDSSGT